MPNLQPTKPSTSSFSRLTFLTWIVLISYKVKTKSYPVQSITSHAKIDIGCDHDSRKKILWCTCYDFRVILCINPFVVKIQIYLVTFRVQLIEMNIKRQVRTWHININFSRHSTDLAGKLQKKNKTLCALGFFEWTINRIFKKGSRQNILNNKNPTLCLKVIIRDKNTLFWLRLLNLLAFCTKRILYTVRHYTEHNLWCKWKISNFRRIVKSSQCSRLIKMTTLLKSQ